MKLDLNHKRNECAAISSAVNVILDRQTYQNGRAEMPRTYLGASSIGHECLRRVQLDWGSPKPVEAKTRRIYDRGHWGEKYTATILANAGFKLTINGPSTQFSQANGLFQGHVDGIITSGPIIPGFSYPCLWECKTLGKKGWDKLSKQGVKDAYPHYYSQVQLYMAYCGLTSNPAMFTALCADTMDLLHLLVPFDAQEAQRVSDRAVTVIQAVQAGEALPRISNDPNSWHCKYCSHNKPCHAYN